jgi:hypothetical protein
VRDFSRLDSPLYIAAASSNRRQPKLAETRWEADEYWLNSLSPVSYPWIRSYFPREVFQLKDSRARVASPGSSADAGTRDGGYIFL